LIAGYIGRNLAKHIHENQLASEVRLVDKHLPELAWLAPEFKEACSRDRFMQADASQERACPSTSPPAHEQGAG
jgi:nucleoside-diphosphate-sugar epimerase